MTNSSNVNVKKMTIHSINQRMDIGHVYVLKLQNDKFYVGFSKNSASRIKSHFDGTSGVEWVRNNPPITCIDLYEGTLLMEHSKTEEMMCEYGIDNVRGGAFSLTEIPKEQIEMLNKKFQSWHGACFSCGLTGHYSRECGKRFPPKRFYETEKKTNEGITLWSSLDSPYKDTVIEKEYGFDVMYSGQKNGGNDHLIKIGANFFYRETKLHDWIIAGVVQTVKEIESKEIGIRKYLLTIETHSSLKTVTRARGKRAACIALGLKIPLVNAWEKSGIIVH